MPVASQTPVRRTDLQRVPGCESLHGDAATFQAIRLDMAQDPGPTPDPLATSADSVQTTMAVVGSATAAASAMAVVDATEAVAAEGQPVHHPGVGFHVADGITGLPVAIAQRPHKRIATVVSHED